MRSRLSLLLALTVGVACGAPRGELVATSIDGERLDLLAGEPAAVVLFFVTPDCPISNRYVPEINRLAAELGESGARAFLVYPDPAFSLEQIRRHRAEFDLAPPGVLDPEHELVARTGVEVTPEAAVFKSNGELAYRGRIDNRFVDFGKTRPQATERDLRRAIEAVLEGRAAPQPSARAVGCYIPSSASG